MGGVLLLAGLVVGGVLAWIAAGSRGSAAAGDWPARLQAATAEIQEKNRLLDAAREREATNREQIARLDAENKRIPILEQQLEAANAKSSEAEQKLATANAQLGAQAAALESTGNQLSEKFDALAGAALRNNNSAFLVLASQTLGAQQQEAESSLKQKETAISNLVTPIERKFEEFRQKVEALNEEGIRGRTELKTQIENLRTLNERLSADAESLVTALKGSSKAQGDWGEFVLEKLLESAGLREGHEYRKQESLTRDDGKRARPDVILDLPGARHLVIDSKVSMDDYTQYCSSGSDAERDAALAKHLASVRTHIRGLSAQNYQALHALKSLDFVIMFVPIEPAFMLAIEHDGKLWEEAWAKNVLLVSPSTLLFVLRTVAQLWRQERQNRGIQKVLDRSKLFYEELAGFAEDLVSVGDSLRKAQESYDSACWKLSTKKGSVVRQAEMLRDLLEKKPAKPLPASLVELAMEDEPLSLAAEVEEDTSGDSSV